MKKLFLFFALASLILAGCAKDPVADKPDVPDDPNQKIAQELSFDSPEVEWILGDKYKIGGSYTPQSVSGARTTVNYVSLNDEVATIASGGKVTILAEGETTIMALAAEDEKYYAATATYQLKISASDGGFTAYIP